MAKSLNKPSVRAPRRIETSIRLVRDQRVMLDSDLAALYGVTTKALNQAVKRNIERFPDDFMFQLTWEEADIIRTSVIEIASLRRIGAESRSRAVSLDDKPSTNIPGPRSQNVTLKKGANVKYRPFVFTEQGISMLSSVLRSPRAVLANIEIMRAFVRMRELLSTHRELGKKLDDLEMKYDSQFKVVFQAIRDLTAL